MKEFSRSVKFLKGVGPSRAKILKKLSIETIEDILYYFPRRYEDRKNFISISQIKEDSSYTLRARILSVGVHSSFKRRNFNIVTVSVADNSGKIDAVWFNQRFLANMLKVGQEIILYGELSRYKDRLQLNSPEFEIISEDDISQDNLNVGRIVPIYSLAKFLSQRQMRRLVKNAIDDFISQVRDFLPYDVRSREGLINLAKALISIHFPQNFKLLDDAYRRLCFDDCFLYQIPILMRKVKARQRKGISLETQDGFVEQILPKLPFKLTPSQFYVLIQIEKDLSSPIPMQRLLQGDVGSGKTIVAFLSALVAIEAGVQVALMVPTEIIAKQHFRVLAKVAKDVGKDISFGLLTGSLRPKEKQGLYDKVKDGGIDLLIGTHALLSEKLRFEKLGLVIIDEQHKFGVEQRAELSKRTFQENGKYWPHNLIMTATPIPRTLAMTIYGDLEVSVLKELPPARQPIITKKFSQGEVEKAYGFLKEVLACGGQAYIIYPIIEESQSMDLKAAKAMYEALRKEIFKDFRIGLIHSRLNQTEQGRIMEGFYEGKIDILVATSILEVGVDVPDASCILIEEADRFGLSTLHQLRGRVGRSDKQSYCLIVSSSRTQEGAARIKAITSLSDGFKLAEADLRIRGPGQFFGREQHGLSDLKFVDPLGQMHILKNARDEAIRLLDKDPQLSQRQHHLMRLALKSRYPDFETLMMTG
ncbi:MAG: ATP-dependent DNA helicase RecG [Candidatus Omnitrophica bacterium]|nr:ATP-dependent DNA helicase RecG [Candidatus Omnitrophota bacterium]